MNKLFIFGLLAVLTLIADRLLFVTFPNYLLNNNFSATDIGLIFSLGTGIFVVSRYFIGRLSDSYGRKRILSLGLLVHSIAIWMYPFLTRVAEYAVVRALQQFGETLHKSVEDSLIADTFKKKRLQVVGKLGTLVPFGRALGAVIGVIVTAFFALHVGFFFAALVLFVGFIVFQLFFKEGKKPRKRRTKKRKIKKTKSLRTKQFYSLVIIGFLISLNYAIAYFPAFFVLARDIGVTENLLFMMLLAVYVISIGLTHIGRKWIEKIGRTEALFTTIAIFSFFIMIYPLVLDYWQFFLVLLGISAAFSIFRIVFKTLVMDATKSRTRGGDIGLVKTFQGAGDIIGPLIGGLLIDFASLESTFYIAGVIGLAAALLASYMNY